MGAEAITLDFGQFLFSASRALDAVEQEVLGAAQNHAQRVAYLSARLGKALGMTEEERVDLASYAALHDNALTEYVTAQRRKGVRLPANKLRDDFRYHCDAGEENIRDFPFLGKEKNIIRYHHENFDGSGFFGLRGESIPLMARILRMVDQVDVRFQLSSLTPEKREKAHAHLEKYAGVFYDPALIAPFILLLDERTAYDLDSRRVRESMRREIPARKISFCYPELIRISSVFAHIIDYKSPFTMNHSKGIAEKTRRMAEYYQFDYATANEVYIAAYLHDIGKLAVPDMLLEKPGKLTQEEFEIVKKHVWFTHEILSAVDSFRQIDRWASGHHERLDGTGYYQGLRGDRMDFCTRLLCCIDVYQALVEDRPYRAGMNPDRAVEIMRTQAEAGKLDGQIVEDITRILQ